MTRFLACLTPVRLNVYYSSAHLAPLATLTERWYGGRYSLHPLPKALLAQMQAEMEVQAVQGAQAVQRVQVAVQAAQIHAELPVPAAVAAMDVDMATNSTPAGVAAVDEDMATDSTPGAGPGPGPGLALDLDLALGTALLVPSSAAGLPLPLLPLSLPGPNWALPVDTTLRQPPARLEEPGPPGSASLEEAGKLGNVGEGSAGPPQQAGSLPGTGAGSGTLAGVAGGVASRTLDYPRLVVDAASLRMWYRQDTSFLIPKVAQARGGCCYCLPASLPACLPHP